MEHFITNIIQRYIHDAASTVIQCGHFALIHGNHRNRLVPGIYQDLEKDLAASARIHPYMGEFPLETFKLGVRQIDEASAKKEIKLLLLVNDWQWVKSAEDGAENEWRSFFNRNGALPESYARIMQEAALKTDRILPFTSKDGFVNHDLFFSETSLRGYYARGEWKETCPVNGSCAQEFVPLVSRIKESGADLFINFIPEICKKWVEHSAEALAASGLFAGMRLINIYPRYSNAQTNFFKDADVRVHDL